MALIRSDIVEMPADPNVGAMPPYQRILEWVRAEVLGLTPTQLDFDDDHPDREWMWWSIRRQASHMAWDSLVLPHRRCAQLLWPDGDVPEPIVWADHRLGPHAKWDRVLDETLYWELPEIMAKLELGLSWLERAVTETPMDVLRSTEEVVPGTFFWRYVITTLPRGAWLDAEQPGCIRYDLEGSLWMGFYELLSHIRTIQRLKRVQELPLAVDLPRVGYLHLPEYWGETDANGPSMERLSDA